MRVGEIVAAYLAHQEQRSKASTFDQIRRNLNKYAAPLHAEAVSAIERATIYQLHKRLTASAGAVQANRTLATLNAMFAWAMRAGLAKLNPAALVPKNREAAKDRVLSNSELQIIWRATDGLGDYDRIVRLLMLTGCRRDEIGGLRWSEITGNIVTVPEARTKTAILHEVPLSMLALEQLPAKRPGRDPVFGEGQGGFSGWSRSKARLDVRIMRLRSAEAGLPEAEKGVDLSVNSLPAWGLHDFRRTLSTRLNDAGVEPHVVEALLGHAGAKRGIAGVYNRASYR
jgi:integrase